MSILVGPAIELANKLIGRWFPDPEAKAQAQRELRRMELDGDLQETEIQMKAIIAEAKSTDGWTSRARPTFLYVFYFVILALVVVAPIIGIFHPDHMAVFFANVGTGFKAIPEELWWTFSAGYLGYAGARTYEKTKR